jgi:hypothetical protein
MLSILCEDPSETEHLIEENEISTIDSDEKSLELSQHCKKKNNYPNLHID